MDETSPKTARSRRKIQLSPFVKPPDKSEGKGYIIASLQEEEIRLRYISHTLPWFPFPKLTEMEKKKKSPPLTSFCK